MDEKFMQATYDTALAAGLEIIPIDTAARIMAVLYVHGNNEFMCHSTKFKVETNYIQKRFHIEGRESPDIEIVKLIQQYITELELYDKRNPDERYPEWAKELFKKRYGFKLIN